MHKGQEMKHLVFKMDRAEHMIYLHVFFFVCLLFVLLNEPLQQQRRKRYPSYICTEMNFKEIKIGCE